MTEVGGAGSWKQTIFYPYMHACLYGRGTALLTPVETEKYDSKEFCDVPYLSSVAVYEEETGELTIFAVNRSVKEEIELTCDIRSFMKFFMMRILKHITVCRCQIGFGHMKK